MQRNEERWKVGGVGGLFFFILWHVMIQKDTIENTCTLITREHLSVFKYLREA
jgi:hypothetical protein